MWPVIHSDPKAGIPGMLYPRRPLQKPGMGFEHTLQYWGWQWETVGGLCQVVTPHTPLEGLS